MPWTRYLIVGAAIAHLAEPCRAESREIPFAVHFPTLGGGPIGCSVVQERSACVAAPSRTSVHLQVQAGFADLLRTQMSKDERCVSVTVRLWVDHKGIEGRECLASTAAATAHIDFSSTLAAP
jgi:hypothetical protein